VFLQNGVYCFERVCSGARSYVAYDPQPTEDSVVTLCRYYSAQKGYDSFKRRVSWLQKTSHCSAIVALVEYIGEPLLAASHGNSKDFSRPYVRTPADTMTTIAGNVESVSCKVMYDDMIADMDVLDAPRDTRVVHNKKYNVNSKIVHDKKYISGNIC